MLRDGRFLQSFNDTPALGTRQAIGIIIVAVALAAVVVITRTRHDPGQTMERQSLVEMLQLQKDKLAKLQAENASLSNLVALSRAPGNEPSLEILRLRGEVGELRRALMMAEQQKIRTVDQLTVTEVDLDSFMNIPIGATPNDALAEIQRVGARLVANEPGFILAGISIPTTSSLSPSVSMEFYFDGDRLVSKKYMRLP